MKDMLPMLTGRRSASLVCQGDDEFLVQLFEGSVGWNAVLF